MNALYFLLFPFVSAVVLALCGRFTRLSQWVNLAANVAWAYLFVRLYQGHNPGEAGQFSVVYSWNWLPFLKSQFSLGLDGLNFPLMALNVFLSLTLSLYSLGKKNLTSGYFSLFMLLNGASVGSLMAADAFAFYCFWEFMLIPMYFLIGRWGSKNRVYAALKFFAFTMGGSLFLLLSILGLAYGTSVPSLGWHDLVSLKLPFGAGGLTHSLQGLLFLGFLIAFAVKIPVWPVHTWLPDAHTEAPTGASVILAGVLLKLGVYGIARWCLPIFPEASAYAAPSMIALGCAGIVLGAFAAWKQSDIKRMIAFSSVSHLGFMVLGLFALRVEAFQGAMFQNLAHGLSTGLLFLVFGIIYDRTHSREISLYSGLGQHNPRLATVFVFAAMASIGLPGLPGFVGEFLILTGTFVTAKVGALVALSGVLLGAIYTLSLVRRSVFGTESVLLRDHAVKLSWNEWLAVVPYVLALAYLGIGPQRILSESAMWAASLGWNAVTTGSLR